MAAAKASTFEKREALELLMRRWRSIQNAHVLRVHSAFSLIAALPQAHKVSILLGGKVKRDI